MENEDMPNTEMATDLETMLSAEQVRENVKTAMEVQQGANIDVELLQQVEEILQPVKNLTWLSGLEENN